MSEPSSTAPLLGDDESSEERLYSERYSANSGNKFQSHRSKCLSCRHVLTFFAFLGFVNVYALRVNLSVAIVAMVKRDNSSQANSSTIAECPQDNSSMQTNYGSAETFRWTDTQQGLVLGAFFYGYITTQILGGWLAERIGGKHLYGGGVLCTSVLTLLTPIAAHISFGLLIAVRVLEGVGEGVTFPAMHAILAKWAPPLERSKLGTFIYAGAQLGTVISMPISGLLCHYGFAGGWPSVFYVFGTAGCVWWLFWVALIHDSPSQHPRISIEEKNYIQQAIGHTAQKPPTPWLKIFTSRAVWGTLLAHLCNNWGYYTLLTCLPKYMQEVLQFNISANALLSGLPYLAAWVLMNVSGQIADCLRHRRILSTTVVRKIFNSLGLGLPAIFLLAVGYIGCDRAAAVVLITLSIGAAGMAMAGYGVNHLDIGPPFAGTLMGITNSVATIPGFLGPLVVGVITTNHSREEWQTVFYISSVIYVAGVLLFVVLGSGEEQSWSQTEHPLVTRIVGRTDDNNDDSDEDNDN